MFFRTAKILTFCFALALLIPIASSLSAGTATVADYRERVVKAESELAELRHSYTSKDLSAREQDTVATIAQVREILPAKETVAANDTRVDVDNAWLHEALRDYEKMNHADQSSAGALDRMTERLRAIEEQLKEGEPANRAGKDDNKARLAEILRRSAYNQKAEEGSALERLWLGLWRWLEKLLNRTFPQVKPIQPGAARAISGVAQILVVALALAVLAYVAWKLAPRYLRNRSKKKTRKRQERIVLGERLEPDQTPSDLFSQAEALARGGDLRAAIRKAYIALLCELDERKLISLAKHKTNRDYLQAVRATSLYGSMRPLTVSFENHWYGFVPAGENDWKDFREGYQKATSSQ